MRNEVLRMERVTYKEDEVVKLKDFNLQIFQGEVIGFLPVNSHGKTALLKLLERNRHTSRTDWQNLFHMGLSNRACHAGKCSKQRRRGF